jgi:hypothetical protein
MRDDEPWRQDVQGRLLNASVELNKDKDDELVIGNAQWELEMALEIMRARSEAIYDAKEKERMEKGNELDERR